MQRRAAAVYFVLFLVIGGGAYGFMQVGMSAPTVDFEDATTYSEGDTLTVGGTTYTVTTVEAETESGGHGGGTSVSYTGELTTLNESNMETATLENGSTVPFREGTYTVTVANETNVSEFSLVETQNVTAIIANDSDATTIVTDDETGERFVRFQNGSTALLSEYLPTPDTATRAVGDEFFYAEENVTTTVDAVTQSEVTLTWNNPANESIEFGEGGNITLGGESFFGHFPSEDTVQVLRSDQYYSQYQTVLDNIDYFHERTNGMWGIVIVSFLAAIVLVSAAYLPNK
ncbi:MULTISPECIES: hypothetical protein [Salinibaculum]|uniref:hypothetical protein n=1 Tax=Salinibaculum TaxID=2732368 RepID=UPI0030CE5A64